jgi:hypothetical protein
MIVFLLVFFGNERTTKELKTYLEEKIFLVSLWDPVHFFLRNGPGSCLKHEHKKLM